MDLLRNTPFAILLATFFSAFPGVSLGFEGYIETGLAKSRSKADIDQLSDGILTDSSFDKQGNAAHITLGARLTSRLSAEISYRDFDTTLSDDLHLVRQKSVSYDIQLKYHFFKQNKWSAHALLGIANWHSKLKQQFWIQLYPDFLWGDETVIRESGFSPKAGLGLDYMVTDSLSIGVQYNYYRRLGGGEEIIDRFKLLIGDLPGAATGHEPLKFAMESYSLNLTYWF